MDVEAAQLFFSLLALAAGAGAIALVVLRLVAPRSAVLAAVDDAALWIAFLVAAVSTAGSLYFSEVADFIPCQLCWFQRIAMYPLAVILLVAAIRKDRSVRWYAGPGGRHRRRHLDVPLPRRVEPRAGGGLRHRPVVLGHLVPRARLRHPRLHGTVRIRRHPGADRSLARSGDTVKSRTPLVIGIVVAVVAVIAVVAVVVAGGDDDSEDVVVAPPLVGQDYAGNDVEVVPGEDGPLMLVFLAHWCPHCNAEIPVLQQWEASGAIPEDLTSSVSAPPCGRTPRTTRPTSGWRRWAGRGR